MRARLVVVSSALALCCGSSLPTPPRGPHPVNAALFETVEYPPPPARVEMVPEAPDSDSCVWLDGHWEWVGRRWQWVAGEWIVPPKGCYWASPNMYWVGSDLSYLKPHWYPNDADELPVEEARTACAKPTPCGKPAERYQRGR